MESSTQQQPLHNIRLVLVAPSHPGNIGAVARAMKTMALNKLTLVNPKQFPSAECTVRASGADDLLANASICDSVEQAVHDCHLVIGSSARRRCVAWPELNPQQTAVKLLAAASQGPVALLLGREATGLSNQELDYCHAVAYIPSDPEFSSLNLAAAAQIFAYEIRMAYLSTNIPIDTKPRIPAPQQEMELMFEHLTATIKAIDYADPAQSHKLMRRLRRLFYRAQPDRIEINMLRGLLSSAQHLAAKTVKLPIANTTLDNQ